MTNINVTILEPENPEDIQFCLNPKKNSIVMAVDELDARIQGDFEVKVLGIHVTGIAYVNITDMEFDIELRMETQEDVVGSHKYAPALSLEDININVDPNKVDIDLEGKIPKRIIDLFIDLFKKEVLSGIIENTKKQAKEIF